MKTPLAILALLCAMSLAAAQVTVSGVRQRYPWNGLVDVDYTVSGVSGDGGDYRLALEYAATAGGTAVSGAMTNFTVYAGCDLPTSNGAWRVTWDAQADGHSFRADDLKVTAKLYKTDTALTDAEFIVVDLSSGAQKSGAATGTDYPVRFVASGLAEAKDFNRTLYKTDRLVLKRVKGGTFSMGSTSWSASKPVHEVTLSDYFLGLFEVTCTQYMRVMAETANVKSAKYDGNPVDERPAEGTPTWERMMFSRTQGSTTYDCFSRRLNLKAKHAGSTFGDEDTTVTFTLPTEAQWEYACRAGTATKYFWGDSSSAVSTYAWTSECSKSTTHAVGQLQPNDWGFYDMIGNVSEVVYDWYASYSSDAATDPTGPASGTKKLFRGGNWFKSITDGSYAGACAFRSSSATLTVSASNACGAGGCIGFRIAFRLH